MGGRQRRSAALMMLLILVLVVIPITVLAAAAADQLPALFGHGQGLGRWRHPLPEQLKSLPVVGDRIYDQLTQWRRQGAADGAGTDALEPVAGSR